MIFPSVTLVLVLAFSACQESNAFTTSTFRPADAVVAVNSDTALSARNRKARRMQNIEKQTSGRSKQFFDAIEDARGKIKEEKKDEEVEDGPKKMEKPKKPEKPDPKAQRTPNDERAAYISEAEREMEQRPEVSTTLVDEETGIEVIANGRCVMDIVTRKAVKLSDLGPEYRLAQMFPGVPPEMRIKLRFDLATITISDMVQRLKDACYIKLEDGSMGVPPHPSISNKALDFVLANRDHLGFKMKRLLVRLKFRAMSQGNKEEALEMDKLARNFFTIENYVSGPFRQILTDAEVRLGPNFGNLDMMAYANGDLYERIGNYIVLKAMVAHWEKKVVDAEFLERTADDPDVTFMQRLARGDPKRYLPDPPILFRLSDCTQVCVMAQQMCKTFYDNKELSADFPPEIVFLEDALTIKGGTALRKYMIDEFCPKRGITPEGLREGMRRFYQQLANMQADPYGELTGKVQDLAHAMGLGSNDEIDPYGEYLANLSRDGPGSFETYTFNFNPNSLVRFLDSQYESVKSELVDSNPEKEVPSEKKGGFDLGEFFDLGKSDGGGGFIPSKPLRQEPKENEDEEYTPPVERAAGRPHNLGWLKLLDDSKEKTYRLGEVPPGRIIPDDE